MAFFNPPRNPVPRAHYETAKLAGYERIRFWGDRFSDEFKNWITEKNRAVAAAIEAGKTPDAAHRADFLSISGGGDRGAFAAGLLKGWTELGKRPCFEAVTGVSAGALAAPFAFLGPSQDQALHDIFTGFGSGKLFRRRSLFGYFSDALNDTVPLRRIIRKYASDAFLDEIAAQYALGRRVFVLTTNLDAQRPVTWDLSAIAASGNPGRRDLFVEILLASAAIPGVFPPVVLPVVADDGKTYDELHVDGGATTEVVFVPPAVKLMKFERMFFDERRRRRLFVIENAHISPEYVPVQRKTLPLTFRGVSTMVKYQTMANLRMLERIAKVNDTEFMFHAIPTSFDATPRAAFDPHYAVKLYDVGVEVGRQENWARRPESSPILHLDHFDDPSHRADEVS